MGPRRVVGKIRDGALAVAAYSVHDLELNVLGQHGADRVEVVRVEALHIGGEPFSLSGVERRLWRLAGVGCERAQALPYQARDVIPLPIDRAILDFIPVGDVDRSRNTVQGLLIAAPREPVSVLVRAVEQAGLRVARVDLAAFAALRAVADQNLPVEAVVDLGAHLTNVVIHNGGVPQLVRTIARGGDELTTQISSRMTIDGDAAELAKRTIGIRDDGSEMSGAVRDAIRPLLSELRSTLSAYEQTHPGTVIERILLTGGGAAMPGLADELSRIGNVPVEVVEPMRHVGSRRASKHSAPDEAARVATAVCLGLAMGAAA